jgi:PAS domain S-box-containing protein
MEDLKMGTKTGYEKPDLEKPDQNMVRQRLIDHMQLDQAEAYRLIIENTYEAIAVAQGEKICFCNNRAAEISGYSRHELLTQKFIDLVHPDDRVTVIDVYTRRLKGQTTPDAIPLRILTKDGAVKWALGSAVKITWKGQPAVMGFIIDITSQKQAEEALRESGETLGAILNSINDLALLVDPEGTVLAVNTHAAQRFEKSPEEIKGLNIYSLMPPEIQERRRNKARELIHKKQPLRYTEERDGQFFDCNLFPILDGTGNVKCFTVFVQDITERTLAEEGLRKYREVLEHRVSERTKELEIKARNLEDVNTALKVLMKRLDEDKKVTEEKVLFNVRQLVEPNLEKLKKCRPTERQKNLLEIIESNLNEIVSPFARGLSNSFLKLTPTEIQVANHIRQGKTTKEIADMLNLSVKTIEFHRDNIRRKIGIKNRKINLRTHLLSIQ